MKSRLQAGLKVAAVIISCQTPEHLACAEKMVDSFETLYGKQFPLKQWLLQTQFNVTAAHSAVIHRATDRRKQLQPGNDKEQTTTEAVNKTCL